MWGLPSVDSKFNVQRLFWPVVLGLTVITTIFAGGMSFSAAAQGERTPIALATIVPPTLLPTPIPPTATPLPTQSVLARIRARTSSTENRSLLIVGIAYNIPRFAMMTETGCCEGFEADLAQALADDWGVQLQYRQVTRQNALNLLLGGQVDLLMGEVIISRDPNIQAQVDFSDPLFINKEEALVLAGSSITDVKQLAGQAVGVVRGSRAEQALTEWSQANGLQINVTPFNMLDDAIRALGAKQVVAVIGDRWELDDEVGNGKVQGIQLVDGGGPKGIIRSEPYAIAMQRYDDALRTMVNRTLQRLANSKRLDPIYDHWFPKDLMPLSDRVYPRVWSGLDDDGRTLGDFPLDLVMPANPVLARIKAGQPIRVAGLGAQPDANGRPAPLEALNQALVNEMARRWGIQVQSIPGSAGHAEDFLANGQADLAVGVEPFWPLFNNDNKSGTDRVDYAAIYATHGYRLLVRFTDDANGFGDLFAGSRNLGIYADDNTAFDLAKKLAESAGIPPDSLRRIPIYNDNDIMQGVVTEPVIRAVFADSLRLIPFAQANSKYVRLTDRTYSEKPIGFAVPRNDADFRALVEVTLQDMARDGTYQRIWASSFNLGDPLTMVIWPGPSEMFGIKTS